MPNNPIRRPLGALPSPADPRDLQHKLPVAMLGDLPPAYVVSPLQPVRDQGNEGTCVGHALASGVLGYHEERTGWHRVLAVRAAYEGARQVEPVAGEGAYPRAAFKYGQQSGLPPEADWPYTAGQSGSPGPAAAADAPLNRVGAYAAVAVDVAAIKGAIVHTGPVLIVIPVTDGFWVPDGQGRVANRGPVVGYHAVALVGYDDARGAYRLRNSWGAGWGEGGYCWLPYTHPITEAWTATAAITAPPPPPAPRPWWAFLWPF